MLAAFTTWLKQRQYSSATIRNYGTDIRKYFSWLEATTNQGLSSNSSVALNQNTLLSYFHVIFQENSFKRQLASLKLFCQYAQDQNLISKDIFSLAEKSFINRSLEPQSGSSDRSSLLAEFKKYLHTQKASPNTIRNYLADVKDYLDWLNV